MLGLSKLFSTNVTSIELNGEKIPVYVTSNLNEDDDIIKYELDMTQIPVVYQCIEIISNDIASLPLKLYIRTDAGRQQVRNSPLAKLLLIQPNPYTNSFVFWKTAAQKMLLGNCFIKMNTGGWTFLPEPYTTPYMDAEGVWWYGVMYTDDEKKRLGLDMSKPVLKESHSYKSVLHLSLTRNEKHQVQTLAKKFKAQFDLGTNMANYEVKIFNSGGKPVGYLTTDTTMTLEKKKENVKGFKRLFRANTGDGPSISMVDGGLKFMNLNMTPEEIQLINSKKDYKGNVAAIFNMPLWKLGVTDGYKYASAELAQKDYIQQTLQPWLKQIELEILTKALSPEEQDFIYPEFDRDKLVTIDAKTLAEIDNSRVAHGVITRNEARSRINLNSIEGASTIQIPANTQSSEYVAQREMNNLKIQELEILEKTSSLASQQPTEAPESPSDSIQAKDTPMDPVRLQKASQRLLEASRKKGISDQIALKNTLSAIHNKIWKIYGSGELPENMKAFQKKYLEGAEQRDLKPEYEICRMVNACLYETIRHQKGSSAQVKWVNGELDGEIRNIGDAFKGKVKHPPLNSDDCGSYIQLI